jgi:hypothetical protein
MRLERAEGSTALRGLAFGMIVNQQTQDRSFTRRPSVSDNCHFTGVEARTDRASAVVSAYERHTVIFGLGQVRSWLTQELELRGLPEHSEGIVLYRRSTFACRFELASSLLILLSGVNTPSLAYRSAT